MKRLFTILGLLVAVGAAAYLTLNRRDADAGAAPVLAGAPAGADLLARGEYLTKAADCAACHTVPDSGRPFAGGVAFKLPFGTLYSTNITPDSATGIGGWSDDEFVTAVRDGIGRHGEHLYPAFPYTSYTQLSRADVLAIKAYLATVAAVAQANRANDLSFPFSQRWAMGFWNAAFFKDRRFAADPSQSAQWNTGAYLATALGHCAECHTPRNFAFALRQDMTFAGAEQQGWRAYNITPDSRHGIGAWSDADLAQYLKTGHAEGHASASGPMGEAVAYSLQYLEPADIGALIAYLRGVPAQQGAQPVDIDPQPAAVVASTAVAPGSGDRSAHPRGLQLFEGACASCHQWNGRGQQSPYASLVGTRGVNDASAANVTQAILQGANLRVGGSDVYMPAFGAAYSDSEVAALANYVVGHFGGKQGTVTPDEVAKRRNL
jgi:mono/diheme cytochrome c family protein